MLRNGYHSSSKDPGGRIQDELRVRPTDLLREEAQQRLWRPRAGGLDPEVLRILLLNEFKDPAHHRAIQAQLLRQMLQFASTAVPYYRARLAALASSVARIRDQTDLRHLPILSRSDVQAHAAELSPAELPGGQRWGSESTTSGSTGQHVRIRHTELSQQSFTILKQRELRWFRFDPSAMFAAIRPPIELPRRADGRECENGMIFQLSGWPLLGRFFETGLFVCFAHTNSMAQQLDWLEQHRPQYLLSQSAHLEHLAFAYEGRSQPDGYDGLQAISQQLTPQMRERIEDVLGAPVQQNYGLNEFGIVASRCPEAGRYHVHVEQCLVEIVNTQGEPCAPGEVGRILVTGLNNFATPLIRYDSGDLAQALDGPCPCGRTLPAFGDIQGRYRRIAFLPEGTWDYWVAVQTVLGTMPRELRAPLRQYQLHQLLDGRFELRLVCEGALEEGFQRRIEAAWQDVERKDGPPLKILASAAIAPGPGGKFENFISDFSPPPDPAD